jgi:putative tryptophan/tyrosine transport system substrate-binding protein
MQRRDFITLLGGAAAWPIAAQAQQPALPAIGFLAPGSPGPYAARVTAFQQGLIESGFVEGGNIAVEYLWAGEHYERLRGLAGELVARRVALIVAEGEQAALAAKAATMTTPIVFASGVDPVRSGLVASLSRPEGNVTGVSWVGVDLVPKRLQQLHDLLPSALIVGLLLDVNTEDSASQATHVEDAARTLGLTLVVRNARTANDIDMAFAELIENHVAALLVSAGALLVNRRAQIIGLAARHAIPASYATREFAAEGGLMSYGNDVNETFRRAGVYAARLLKGARPADLPVEFPTRFELVINLNTAKTLGLTIPREFLLLADEVIE